MTEDENERQSEHASSDPFESLESDVSEREGDPFESLTERGSDEQVMETGGHAGDSASGDAGPMGSSETPGPVDWFDEFDGDHGIPQAEGSRAEHWQDAVEDFSDPWRERRATSPFADLPGNKRGWTGDPFEVEEELFKERDTGDLDPDAVWQELTAVDSGDSEDQRRKRTYADVSKHTYCEQCEYVSGPPEIDCQHDGTEIVEFLDMETIRVIDCPVVAERLQLERR